MDTSANTIRDIVTSDFRTAAVFQKYGLDFCCGGGVTVGEACDEAGLDRHPIEREILSVLDTPRDGTPDFKSWELDFLADYIVSNHHSYIRRVLPVMRHHADKVARVHGVRHPETVEIASLFNELANELETHMMKEEGILFPYVKTLVAAGRRGEPVVPPMFGTIGNPINVMEIEHDAAGEALHEIRRLSSGYTLPDDACTTYSVLYQELSEFEADLHRHVHLENNILFPRTIELEQELMGS